MNMQPVVTAVGEQDKAGHLAQAIGIAFQERIKKGNADTLLTLAYSTDLD